MSWFILISLHNITKQYGKKILFADINLHVGDRERIAVVGSNGSGKSTLMKIIVGQIESDSGDIAISRNHRVGYLPQDGASHCGKTLYRELESAFDDILLLQNRIHEIGVEIAREPAQGELQVLTDEMGELQHRLEHRQGYNLETRIRQISSGLGFSLQDLERDTREFSGGWQMRIELAKLLLRKPDVLLLDEPTNHLDIESLEWLEAYVQDMRARS